MRKGLKIKRNVKNGYRMNKWIGIIAGCILSLSSLGQTPAPGTVSENPIRFVNAVLHLGDGTVVEKGFITIDDGKIVNIGTMLERPPACENCEFRDVQGAHISPGLIIPGTSLGLQDISAVRASNDLYEVGRINPNVRSIVAYNTDSEIIPTMRFTGILLAQTTPAGGVVSGTSSIVQLDAWNWEDAAYVLDDAVWVNWPSKTLWPRWWLGETNRRPNPDYEKNVEELRNWLSDARIYSANPSEEPNLVLEATIPVIQGNRKLFIRVDRADEIIAAAEWAKENKVSDFVLFGARDAWMVADYLAENNIPVVLDELMRLPAREDEPIDLPYSIPKMLLDAGVKVGFAYTDELQEARNLPFSSGIASGYGLTLEEALQMVTLNNAEILGISERTGTLEAGKDANLVISEGHILELTGNKIIAAFIEGREIDLKGRQQVLYEKYQEK